MEYVSRVRPRVRPVFGLVRSARERTWSRPRRDPRRTPPCRPPHPGGARRVNCSTRAVVPPARTPQGVTPMDLIHRCCAGLDVHKKTVVACARRLADDGQVSCQVRTFGTMTADWLALGDWLEAEGVRHAALESTGVYWKPVFHLLEGRLEVHAGQRASPQAGPGAQDRRQGRRVDRPALAVRPAGPQLHPAAADPRPARADAAAGPAGPRPRRGGQPHPEGAGGGQHQAGQRRQRRARRLGPRHDPGADRRGRRPRSSWPCWRGGGCGARSRN